MKDGEEGVREVIAELRDKIAFLSDYVELYANISDSIYSFVLDRHGSFISVRSRQQELKSLTNTRFLNLIVSDNRKKAADLFVQCLSGDRVEGRLKLITPNGNHLTVKIAAVPRRQVGIIVGVQGVARQEAVASIDTIHAQVLRIIPTPACIIDLVGNVVATTDSLGELIETEAENIINTHITDWVDDCDIASLQSLLRKTLHERTEALKAYVVASSGIKIPVSIDIRELPEEGHMVCIFTKQATRVPTTPKTITTELELKTILEDVESICSIEHSLLDTVGEVCQSAVDVIVHIFSPDVCSIGLIEDGAVHIVAGKSFPREYIALSETCPACIAIETGDAQYLPDAENVKKIIVPLSHGDTMIGVASIESEKSGYSLKDQLLFKLLARQISHAIVMIRTCADMHKYQSIFERAVEGIYRATIDGHILEANPAFLDMFGYDKSLEDFESLSAKDLYFDKRERQKLIQTLQDEGAVENFETRYVTRNNKKFYGRESAWLVSDSDKIIIESIIRDINHQKQLQEDAAFYNSLLRHDIYNKNEIAIGYLGLLKNSDLSSKDDGVVQKAIMAITEGNKLIETVKKLETIKNKREMKNLLLDDVMYRIIDTYGEEANKRDIEIFYTSSGAIVRGNELIEDLFSNLIKNSIQHSYAERVTIYSKDDGRGWSVFIEDNGVGISSDQKEKIFQQGWRGKGSKGSGLGLYLVKKIVEGFGGRIIVESGKDEYPDGTRFIVWLQKGKKNKKNRIVGRESEALGVRW